jgi:hypothetical protein
MRPLWAVVLTAIGGWRLERADTADLSGAGVGGVMGAAEGA